MRYRVSHETVYEYSDAVSLCHNQVHLTPRTLDYQRCESSELEIVPGPSRIDPWEDYFGNHVRYFSIEEVHRRLSVLVRSVVEVRRRPSIFPPAVIGWEDVRSCVANPADDECRSAGQFALPSPLVRHSPEAADYAAVSFPPGRALVDAVLDLTARIYREFRYDPTATTVQTPPSDVLRKRRGVCQDFAHLEIACLRSMGLPARYVSGYLLTEPPPGQARLIGADASHAWLAVFCPGWGWLDVDPTNNQVPDIRHITLAWGRDYGDVCPIQGVVIGGGQHTMRVSVDVSIC